MKKLRFEFKDISYFLMSLCVQSYSCKQRRKFLNVKVFVKNSCNFLSFPRKSLKENYENDKMRTLHIKKSLHNNFLNCLCGLRFFHRTKFCCPQRFQK